jgi:DNA polymerase-3 subunit epsilon
MTPAFLDTETTGLRVEQGHRIIEIGVVIYDTEPERGSWCHTHQWRLWPDGHPIEPGAEAVHGIALDELRGKPRFGDIVDQLLDTVRGREVVIHNDTFDLGFLDAELARIGREPFATHCARVTCAVAASRRVWPDQSASLDALCDRLGVDRSARAEHHGALLDADLLAQCWMREWVGRVGHG